MEYAMISRRLLLYTNVYVYTFLVVDPVRGVSSILNRTGQRVGKRVDGALAF